MYWFLFSRRWLGILAAVILFAVACGPARRLADAPAGRTTRPQSPDQGQPARSRHSGGRGPRRRPRPRRGTRVAPGTRERALGRRPPTARPAAALRGRRRVLRHHAAGHRRRTGRARQPWMGAGGQRRRERARIPAPPIGTVTVTGRLRPTEPPATGTAPPPPQITRIDVPGIAQHLAVRRVRRLSRAHPAATQPAKAPRLIPPPEPSEGPHLLYAVQWVLFGLMAFGGLRRARPSRSR